MGSWKSTASNVLLGVIGAAATAWTADQVIKVLYNEREYANELHYVHTDDDVQIGLLRHLPESESPGEPVLIVHGLGVNHRHMDLDAKYSVANYLSNKGYDCWVIELRGRGVSDIPESSWTFDDYAKRDIPSAIDYILDKTGYSQLHWVGHSMGAMLFHAVAGAVGYQDTIRSAVPAGGPFHGRNPNRSDESRKKPSEFRQTGAETFFFPFLEMLRRLRIPWTGVARWTAMSIQSLKDFIPTPLATVMINPDNVDYLTIRRAGVRCVERVGTSVLAQFIDWGVNRYWADKSGELNYRHGVSKIEVPTRLIAGSIDKMCPVHNQKSGFEQLASEKKELVIAGRNEDFKADYSHIDMIYGEHARDEIFPLFLDWLKQNPI